MAINITDYINKFNCVVETCTLSNIEVMQLTGAVSSFNNNSIPTVANITMLPSASENTGRLMYLANIGDYLYSDGTTWSRCYDTSYYQYGSVWTWGEGNRGQLGDSTVVDKSSPVPILGGYSDWCQVSLGACNSYAVRTNGSLWAWGENQCGQLGTNSVADACSPVSVVGNFSWCRVTAGLRFAAAIRNDGSIWAWGTNGTRQLGDLTNVAKSSPVSVLGGITNWCDIGAGLGHIVAIRTNGEIWAWGRGGEGQLGNGLVTNQSSPISIVGGFTWCTVASGTMHVLAIRNDGTLWAWGEGTIGKLGDGTTVDKSSPVAVVGGFADWCQVSAGYRNSTGTGFSAGVRTNGTLWTWGDAISGQLGNGATSDRSSPVSVIGGFTDWCQVSTGYRHTLAIRTNGTAWGWGEGATGKIGNSCISNFCSPVSVVGGFTDWTSVCATLTNSIGLRRLYCRGFCDLCL